MARARVRRNTTFDGSYLPAERKGDVRAEERPIGLDGELMSDTWSFNATIGPRDAFQPWTRRMANGKMLTDPANASHWELCRRFFTAVRNRQFENAPHASLSTLNGMVGVICNLIDQAISFGKMSLSELSADEWEIIKKRSGISFNPWDLGRKNTYGRVLFIYNVIVDLTRLYLHQAEDSLYILNDGPSFPVFTSPREVEKLARLLGRAKGKTPDIPEAIAFPLLNAAIEYVVIFSDDVFRLQDTRIRLLEQFPTPRDKSFDSRQRRVAIARGLLESYDNGDYSLFPKLKISTTALSRAYGLDPKTLYHKLYRPIVQDFDGFLANPTVEARLLLESGIDKLARQKQHRQKKPNHRLHRKLIGLPFSGAAGRHSPWPVRTVKDIQDMEKDLWTAAYIVVANFMADRSSEILGLNTECVVRRLDGYYLRIPIYKEGNPEGGTIEERPCPEIVVKAIEVVRRLGHPSRTAHNKDLLFMLERSRKRGKIADPITLNKAIRRFAKVVGAHSINGKVWRFNSHQFRRLFVTIWTSYYEFGGNIEALRKYLGHGDIRTTVRYATGLTQGNALSEKAREMTLKIINSIAFEGREVQGGAAVRYTKVLSRLRIRLVPETRIADWVTHHVDKLKTVLNPMPWGYCVWSRIAGKRAKCIAEDQRKVGKDRPNHKEICSNCAGCANFLKTDVFDGFWAAAYDRHDRIANNPAAPDTLRSAAKIGRQIARTYARLEEQDA